MIVVMANHDTITDQLLFRYRWYHGIITRDEAARRLTVNSFLVRKCSRNGSYVISKRTHYNDVLHSQIFERHGSYYLHGQNVDFTSVQGLIKYNHQRLGHRQACNESPPNYDTLQLEAPDGSSPAAAVAALGRHSPVGHCMTASRDVESVAVSGAPNCTPAPPSQSSPSPSHATAQQSDGKRCAPACGVCCTQCMECTYGNLCCCEASSVCARCWHDDMVQKVVDCCCIQEGDGSNCWDLACNCCFEYDSELATTWPMHHQGYFYKVIHVLSYIVAALILLSVSPVLVLVFLCVRAAKAARAS
eukprot:scpid78314/ scgid2878/ 